MSELFKGDLKGQVNPVAISEEKSDNERNMSDGSKLWKWKYQ